MYGVTLKNLSMSVNPWSPEQPQHQLPEEEAAATTDEEKALLMAISASSGAGGGHGTQKGHAPSVKLLEAFTTAVTRREGGE